MKQLLLNTKCLGRDESGIAATEMGLILVPFSILLMGAFDMGYQNYVRSVMQGTLTEVAREASTENPVFTGSGQTIEDRIMEKMQRRLEPVFPDVDLDGDPADPER